MLGRDLPTTGRRGREVPPPPFVPGGGAHSLAREGVYRVRVPIPTRGHTLWYSLYIYFLCGGKSLPFMNSVAYTVMYKDKGDIRYFVNFFIYLATFVDSHRSASFRSVPNFAGNGHFTSHNGCRGYRL
jgi:hypothetical protein